MTRTCPDDATPLESRALRGLLLDVCPACAGVFFDEGEIAALVGDGPAALHGVEASATPGGLALIECDAPKRCPGCAALMCAYAYQYFSDVRLDGCAHCGGVWVQDGELSKIADHLASPREAFGGLPAARRAAEAQNASALRHQALLARVSSLFDR